MANSPLPAKQGNSLFAALKDPLVVGEPAVSGAGLSESLNPSGQRDWFQVVWAGMSGEEQERARAKARWEQMSLRAVLGDWPALAPPGVWLLIPKPERAP